MATLRRTSSWVVVSCLLLAGLGLIASTAATSPAVAAPLQDQICNWEKLPGQSNQGVYHLASAMDYTNSHMYFYGGLDQTNDVTNFVGKLDLSDPDFNNASHTTVSPTGSRLERYGSVGVYRPAGNDSALYWIAGGERDGSADNDVQEYKPMTGAWVSSVATGAFADRIFASGAYDPDHDVVVVHGGTQRCRADGSDSDDSDACRGANLGTSYLVFNPAGGAPQWQNGAAGGPGQIYGATMVYDLTAKRMLVFGGTTDGVRGRADTYELDLADPDITKAKWSKLATTGKTPPGRFLHSATYTGPENRMIIYGGVTRDAFGSRENAASDTYALDLSQSPPEWSKLDPATVGDRVGSVMAFDSNHATPILHGGRGRFSSGSQLVNRESHYLECQDKPPEPPTPTPPTGGDTPIACPSISNRVPAAVMNAALANPNSVQGYMELQNPSVPESPWNQRKRFLSMRNLGAPWHPLFNSLLYKGGCP